MNLAESIKILATNQKLTKILDIGCGTGRLVKFLNQKGFIAQGCDSAPEAVKAAQINNNTSTIRKTSATSLPYKIESFDLVTSISTIEHLTKKDSREFLKEVKKVLKPGGYLFMVTPNYSSPSRYLLGKKWYGYQDPTHVNYFGPKSIKTLLLNSGFKNINFSFKTNHSISLDKYIPKPLQALPKPFKYNLYHQMFSSPLSFFRDSLWVSAQK